MKNDAQLHRSMILGCVLLVATLATSAQAQKPNSTGVNHFKISFRGVKSGAELRGVAETKVEGKVEGRDYRLEVLGDWVLHREK
jgi:hypothetical protein